jgi:hypothetical protein
MYCLLLSCHCGGVLHSKDPFSTCPGELNSFLHRVPHLSLLPALSAFYSLYRMTFSSLVFCYLSINENLSFINTCIRVF